MFHAVTQGVLGSLLPLLAEGSSRDGAWTQDKKEPYEVLQSFQDDLKKNVRTAGKDKDVRTKMNKFSQETFNRDIASTTPKTPKGAWEYVHGFVDNVARADVFFKGDEDKAERTLWLAACKTAFARELANSKEGGLAQDDLPRADDVYNDLVKEVASIQKRFAKGATEYDKASYDAAKQAFTYLLGRARAPQGDPQALYTKWLIEIDKNYPTSTEDQKRDLGPINALLKTAAKSAVDRARAAPK